MPDFDFRALRRFPDVEAPNLQAWDATDELLVRWALAAPPVATPPDDEVVASVAIPRDIEELRRQQPTDAASWRLRVREQFLGHLAEGLVVEGFDDERGYLFVRP